MREDYDEEEFDYINRDEFRCSRCLGWIEPGDRNWTLFVVHDPVSLHSLSAVPVCGECTLDAVEFLHPDIKGSSEWISGSDQARAALRDSGN